MDQHHGNQWRDRAHRYRNDVVDRGLAVSAVAFADCADRRSDRVWLFYVQHQFEHTVWTANRNWSFPTAAIYGSSHYDLPAVLRWFTANIGVHHIHHLCSRIPFYRLPLALRHHPDLANVGRLTLGQSLACVRLVLWDETAHRLITFRELRSRVGAQAPLAA